MRNKLLIIITLGLFSIHSYKAQETEVENKNRFHFVFPGCDKDGIGKENFECFQQKLNENISKWVKKNQYYELDEKLKIYTTFSVDENGEFHLQKINCVSNQLECPKMKAYTEEILNSFFKDLNAKTRKGEGVIVYNKNEIEKHRYFSIPLVYEAQYPSKRFLKKREKELNKKNKNANM